MCTVTIHSLPLMTKHKSNLFQTTLNWNVDKCAAQSVDYIITLTTNDIVPLLTPCATC